MELAAEREQAGVEHFLSTNMEFFREWVMLNVPLSTLETWLAEQQTTHAAATTVTVDRAVTTTAETHRTSKSAVEEFVRQASRRSTIQRKTKEELLKVSQEEMFLELIRDIAEELDVNSLCHKILINVIVLINADRGSMFLTRGTRDNKYLVSKLFDVTEQSTLEETVHSDENHITVPFGKGIAGMVAETKMAINIKDAYMDPRFNKDIDKKTGYRTRSILCMPVLDYEGEVIGIAQVMNKMSADQTFSLGDIKIFSDYLIFAGIGLTNAQMFEMSIRESKQSQLLLALAKGISAEQTSLDRLMQRVMFDAQDFIGCVRCAVYLLAADDDTEQELSDDIAVVKAFEMNASEPDKIVIPSYEILQHARSAVFATVAARSGQTLIIEDTVSDPNYLQEIIDYDGFRMRTLLSVPITSGKGRVIGVMQMMNKVDSRPFTDGDAYAVETFAVFCGIGIHNCQLFEKVRQLKSCHKIQTEALAYHAAGDALESAKLVAHFQTRGSTDDYNVFSFDFVYFVLEDQQLLEAVVQMFLEINAREKFTISLEVLCEWVVTVKKNYRPVLFHNWYHAITVAQSMFAIFSTGKMSRFFDELEIFAMLVAALSHNMDHRGLTNYMIARMQSPLAILYNNSMLQHHHFDHFLMILTCERTNIFARLEAADYQRARSIVEKVILAADFGVFIKKKKVFEDVLAGGEKHWQGDFNKDLLLQLVVTAADVSSVCKPWTYQSRLELMVQSDFFEQGEHQHLQETEGKQHMAELHLGYIDAVCLPAFQMMVKLELALMPMLNSLNFNRYNWKAIAEGTDQKVGNAADAVKDAHGAKAAKELSAEDAVLKKTKVGKKIDVDADDDVDLMALDDLPGDTESEVGYQYRCATTFPGVTENTRKHFRFIKRH